MTCSQKDAQVLVLMGRCQWEQQQTVQEAKAWPSLPAIQEGISSQGRIREEGVRSYQDIHILDACQWPAGATSRPSLGFLEEMHKIRE